MRALDEVVGSCRLRPSQGCRCWQPAHGLPSRLRLRRRPSRRPLRAPRSHARRSLSCSQLRPISACLLGSPTRRRATAERSSSGPRRLPPWGAPPGPLARRARRRARQERTHPGKRSTATESELSARASLRSRRRGWSEGRSSEVVGAHRIDATGSGGHVEPVVKCARVCAGEGDGGRGIQRR